MRTLLLGVKRAGQCCRTMKLRSSGINAYLSCPRKYQNRYVLGYDTVDTNYVLGFGSAVHAGLEVLANGGDRTEARVAFGKEGRDLPDSQKVIGECLLILYHEAYKKDTLVYEGAEVPWELELSPGVTLMGKFDGIAVDSNGDRCIVEHKTTRSDIAEGANYWQARELDIQLDLYKWAANKLDMDIKYVLYDVVKVPRLKPHKTTPLEKQEFYKRKGKYGDVGDPRPGTRLRAEGPREFKERVMEYVLDNRHTLLRREKFYDRMSPEKDIKDIAELIGTGLFPKNPGNCYAYNRECEYRPVCLNETSLSNTGLYQINPNPLEY